MGEIDWGVGRWWSGEGMGMMRNGVEMRLWGMVGENRD